MNIMKTKLSGVYLIEPVVHVDSRGFFMEIYNKNSFEKFGLDYSYVQDNFSSSDRKGTIRGMHYQMNPKAQTKLISVIEGEIFDVVVDIRRNSPTFGQWVGEVLSSENKRQILVPSGFAHGFCTLKVKTQVHYKVDEYYSPENDRGIRWNDPEIGIEWPTLEPILSKKDEALPLLKEIDINSLC
ncbi:dTDP-4-dehydrorhamnose 3,5-epimerase [Paenibacillus sp. FSL A5-0031]|uniref:dTDP-4-dehydrorhamnose 3,5-epimerase n=1 Tax=Paenibacillus sp. FSL A5-0031 TaxID=1920420 RepID=UPI00096DF7EE|nr:dTDP-4-dehydrorhamnose 3,5-epimerase [Paenibacillus sp. FSL A5-0031]OME70383.1 dTDP-4-dehydrorhamnose 3,5-epimerase [Paenibacillus sp. FSL A5-0031]